MRFALMMLLAACEFEPAPKSAPPASPVVAIDAAPAPPADATQPASVAALAAAEAAKKQPSDIPQPCLDAAVHIADVIIAAAEPEQRGPLEQDRTKLVRRSAETCTRDHWSDASIACFTGANDMATLTKCGEGLKAP